MDNLKRSLEKAIEELRDVAPVERRTLPASDSLEAALASAPSVSPHYRPSDTVPRRQTAPSLAPAADRQRPMPELADDFALPPLPASPARGLAEFGFAPPPDSSPVSLARSAMAAAQRGSAGAGAESSRPVPPATAARSRTHEAVAKALVAAELAAAAGMPLHRRSAEPAPEPGLPQPQPRAAEPAEDAEAAAATLRRERRKLAAIVFASCVGGLASGWFGAMMADNARNGRHGPMMTGDVTGAFTEMPSGTVTAGDTTGKADRVLPIDENRCTVLELDRSNGLTLARPCRDLETADVNTTLSKSDLMARP